MKGQKRVVVLGSTGSIGINALRVIEQFPDKFKVVGLSAFNNVKLLEKQIGRFKPRYVAVGEKGFNVLKGIRKRLSYKLFDVQKELDEIVSYRDVDIVVLGVSGSVALKPFLAAVRCGKTVAPANKEAIVIAGHIIMPLAKKHKAVIIPVDSEQSAIFQCLNGENRKELKKVYLTASGGSLLRIPKSKFDQLSVKDILSHPRWKMGKKITVDSSTLMNKGLEVIEAKWLFGLDPKNIQVLIHPQSIIHSMVEFCDGSILAQMGITDMRLPIQYALTYPQRWNSRLSRTDFFKLKKLTFEKPNFGKFPCLSLAYEAAVKAGTLPCVLNAANEEAVEAFLGKTLKFSKIYKVVEKTVKRHRLIKNPTIKEIWATDVWAREEARKQIG